MAASAPDKQVRKPRTPFNLRLLQNPLEQRRLALELELFDERIQSPLTQQDVEEMAQEFQDRIQ